MTTNINPFIVSGKIPAEYFCDRRKEADNLIKYLTNQENVVLMSQRRMGKSKLVEFCFNKPQIQHNYITMTVDILHTTSFREFLQVLGAVVFDTIATKSEKMMKLFTNTMRSLSASFGYDPVQNTPTFDIRLGDITMPEYTLKEIFEYIEKTDRRCLIVIDEFQQVTKYPEKNVEALLRSYIQNLTNANFVFAGSQRRLMEEMFFSEKRPFFMNARSITLFPIEMDVYQEFAQRLFNEGGRAIDKEAIQVVYDTFLGVTLYLQRIMKEAFNITPNGETCDVGTIKSLIDGYIQECDPRLREQLAFVTEAQKELLYAINEESQPIKSITSSSFIKRHRLKSPSAAQAASKKLLEYDLLTRKEGFYSIADPLMAIWLKSRRF